MRCTNDAPLGLKTMVWNTSFLQTTPRVVRDGIEPLPFARSPHRGIPIVLRSILKGRFH